MVRDNDRLYGSVFRRRLRTIGVRNRPTQPHSPWQNGHVERLIGSIRRECLDQQIILNVAHLRHVLRAYVQYYNFDRTHLALGKDSPMTRPVEPRGGHHFTTRAGRSAPAVQPRPGEMRFRRGGMLQLNSGACSGRPQHSDRWIKNVQARKLALIHQLSDRSHLKAMHMFSSTIIQQTAALPAP
ncbi:MAG: transposase [Hyphomonadaceae bacterium]